MRAARRQDIDHNADASRTSSPPLTHPCASLQVFQGGIAVSLNYEDLRIHRTSRSAYAADCRDLQKATEKMIEVQLRRPCTQCSDTLRQ